MFFPLSVDDNSFVGPVTGSMILTSHGMAVLGRKWFFWIDGKSVNE